MEKQERRVEPIDEPRGAIINIGFSKPGHPKELSVHYAEGFSAMSSYAGEENSPGIITRASRLVLQACPNPEGCSASENTGGLAVTDGEITQVWSRCMNKAPACPMTELNPVPEQI